MIEGEVKTTQGPSFVFIASAKLDQEVFFHVDNIDPDQLDEGERVRFEFKSSEKGPRVTKLERLDDVEEPSEGEEIDDEIGGYWVPIQEFEVGVHP